ncbi:MAG: carboxyl-terminal protease, partial [Bacteroidota bacterium]
MDNRPKNIWTPLFFAMTLVCGLLLGYRLQNSAPLIVNGGQAAAGDGRVEELLRFIDARYVDETEKDR